MPVTTERVPIVPSTLPIKSVVLTNDIRGVVKPIEARAHNLPFTDELTVSVSMRDHCQIVTPASAREFGRRLIELADQQEHA